MLRLLVLSANVNAAFLLTRNTLSLFLKILKTSGLKKFFLLYLTYELIFFSCEIAIGSVIGIYLNNFHNIWNSSDEFSYKQAYLECQITAHLSILCFWLKMPSEILVFLYCLGTCMTAYYHLQLLASADNQDLTC